MNGGCGHRQALAEQRDSEQACQSLQGTGMGRKWVQRKKRNERREGKGSAMAHGCRFSVLDERGSWSCRENYHGQPGKVGEDKVPYLLGQDRGRARGRDREEPSVLHLSFTKE